MSHVNEIIVLGDDDDYDQEQPSPTKAKSSLCNSPKQTNGKEEKSSSQQRKAVTISAENKTLFKEFIEYCSKFTSEHPEVISFLQGRYSKANPSYLSSVEFRNTLGRCLTRVQTKRSKIFVYINELCTALKANSQKRKVILQSQAIQQPAAERAEKLTENDGEAEEVPVKKTGSKRQIRYLENLLRIYSVEIKKLQEKELSLDELEDEDSSYIQESKLKRKLLRIFEKLCEIKDCSSLTGRVIEQRILYRGTRYPEVNRRLEKFINSTRDLFPDYGDVLRVVERANDKHDLGLSRKQMQSMAQDAFRELGNKLQDRRHLDMIYNFGCHLTDSYKSVSDPAQQDTGLARCLRENRNTAVSHLNDIIRKYADLQDDGEEDYRKKMRRVSERNKPLSSEESEEEEESEDSETDIEEELEHSKEMPESEEGEHEEEVPADQENEADQKMDMAAGAEDREKEKEDGDDENDHVMEEQDEATEQESSPASTSSSHDKDSPNTTLESEVEAQLSGSPDLPTGSNDTPAEAKSDDEHNDEQEACETTTNNGDQMEETQEHSELLQSSVEEEWKEDKETANVILSCKLPVDTEKHKNTEKFVLPDMRVSLMEKDKEDSEQSDEDVPEPTEDPLSEESDSGTGDELPKFAMVKEESCSNTEEPCVKRSLSIDSEAASMEGEPVCTDTIENDDNDPVVDTAACGNQKRPLDSPVMEHEAAATNVDTEAADLDSCDNKTGRDLSPLDSSNGVDMATQVQKTSSYKRLKLNKVKATRRDFCKPRKTEEDSPPPYRKRKNMSSENWTKNNGLKRHNGKKYTEDHIDRKCKRAKLNCSSYTTLSTSSDSDDDEEDNTPGLMMTCSPRETPTKPTKSSKKSHVYTQCDPDEVIVLSD
ncbi:death domain-associated protein 6 isoform X3 [Rhinoderma darwinii]|uniref:death domain-associated protein 6 isoform X3 n=1 Tax=Rhinoderma darwinii TaxID=43563 RepID=UPI003F67348F